MATPGLGKAATPNRFDLLRQNFGVPLAILLTAAVWFMRTPVGLSPQGQKALSLFVGIFVLYLTEAIPLAVC
jgi:sodium-dependent dicarboxylate transporter 2/3/5